MTKKIVYLPQKMEAEAELFGLIECENQGLRENDPEFNSTFNKAFKRFCQEAYTHSLTPSGLIGQNPVSSKSFTLSIDSMVDSLPVKNIEAKRLLKKRLKNGVNSLITAYYQFWGPEKNLKAKGLGEKGKRRTLIKKEETSDLEFTGKMKGDPDALLKTEKALYQRLFFATLLITTVYQIMSQDWINNPIDLQKFIPSITDADAKDPMSLYKRLRTPKAREEFVLGIQNHFKLPELQTKHLEDRVFVSKAGEKEKIGKEATLEELQEYALSKYRMKLTMGRVSSGKKQIFKLIPASEIDVPKTKLKRMAFSTLALDGIIVKDFKIAHKTYNDFHNEVMRRKKELLVLNQKIKSEPENKNLQDEAAEMTKDYNALLKVKGNTTEKFLINEGLNLSHISRHSLDDLKTMIDDNSAAILNYIKTPVKKETEEQLSLLEQKPNPKKKFILVKKVDLPKRIKFLKNR